MSVPPVPDATTQFFTPEPRDLSVPDRFYVDSTGMNVSPTWSNNTSAILTFLVTSRLLAVI